MIINGKIYIYILIKSKPGVICWLVGNNNLIKKRKNKGLNIKN